jgi:hypothetical protein
MEGSAAAAKMLRQEVTRGPLVYGSTVGWEWSGSAFIGLVLWEVAAAAWWGAGGGEEEPPARSSFEFQNRGAGAGSFAGARVLGRGGP